MNNVTLSIGQLARYIEEFCGVPLIDNTEVSLDSYGLSINSPQGVIPITHFIKKEAMPMASLQFSNGYHIKVATKHILQKNHADVYVSDLVVGDLVNHCNEDITVSQIDFAPSEDCFDISVPFPHLYYDANGLVHHNTLMTAALSASVEPYGRSIVIVPNKSLVTQTEADYKNLQLDVGVYFGDRKDWGKKHTICTWQSLNNLLKDSQNGTAPCTIGEFIEDVVCVMVDECFDGNSKVLTPLGYILIKDIKAGDKVINYSEVTQEFKVDIVVKQHKNLTKSNSEKMYELEFDNTSKIQVTGNHKFLTTVGWVRADELTEDHEIINKT